MDLLRRLMGLVVGLALVDSAAMAAEEFSAWARALNSIATDDLKRHVDVLSNDTFEGREAGSRGGRAAGLYLAKEFQRLKLYGGGVEGTYFQAFGPGYRNVIGLWPGSDPVLKDEYIQVGAHYDHVGYGNAQNSFGPTGYIHNGADDNASGVAGLLEAAEAFTQFEQRPKRSILFTLWDGEENGLLGSQHWLSNPTVPLNRVRSSLNMDMIGRLRSDRLEVYGMRTAAGLRRTLSQQNAGAGLLLDFKWEMREDSDHYPFYARGIPVLMFHTGLHDDYHRPGDDAEKVNHPGSQRVARFCFSYLNYVANEPDLPDFRVASRNESPATQQALERALPALPGRLGVSWDESDTSGAGVRIARLAAGSAAARSGLQAGDRIVRFADQSVNGGEDLRSLVLSAENPVPVVFERPGLNSPREVKLELAGQPVIIGISWRVDDAEPGVVALTRVVPGSPADRAGLRVNDRIYQVDGQPFGGGEEFAERVFDQQESFSFEVERQGRTRTVTLELNRRMPPAAAEPSVTGL